jgi:hypothetical protein
MAGKVVVHGDELSDQNTLTIESLGHLPRGTYILRLSAMNYKHVVKIIKIKIK